MGILKSFFFDTYALYEIIHENQNYLAYTTGIAIITTRLNLMDLHYILLRTYGLEYADKAFDYFKKFCIEISDEAVKEANYFKYKNKKRNLSYVYCIRFILAKKRNVKFLTGDKEFADLANVEYVK